MSAVEMILSWKTKPIRLNGGQFKNLRDLAEKLKRWNRTMGNVDKPSAAVHRIVKVGIVDGNSVEILTGFRILNGS